MRLRLRSVFVSLWLGGAPLALAQTAFEEGPLARGTFAPNASRLGSGDFSGDARADLVIQREAADGRFVELWERTDTTPSGFRLGPDLGLRATVIDTLVLDVDFDGDRDLAVATADPNDSLVLWINRPAQTPRLQRAPQRFALSGIRSLRRFFGEASAGSVVALRAPNQPSRVFVWNGSDGLTLLTQEFAHAGGAHDAVPVYYGDFSEPAALLSLGAAPQRLWRWTAGGYVENALTGIEREVRLATPLEDGGLGGAALVTAAADGTVETWRELAPATPGGPPAGYQLRDTLMAAGFYQIRMLDTIRIADSPTYHLVIGRYNPILDEVDTLVFELTRGLPGQVGVTDSGFDGGGTAKAETSDEVFLGDLKRGVRSYVVGNGAPPPPLAVSFPQSVANHGYAVAKGMGGLVSLDVTASAPAATTFSVPIVSTLNPPAAAFNPGARIATSRISISPGLSAGSYDLSLGQPTDPSVTLQAPQQTTLTVRDVPTTPPGGPA